MSDLKNYSDKLLGMLNEKKVTKAVYALSESEDREFTVEGESFTLLRTLFGRSVSVNVWLGDKNGEAQGNDFDENAMRETVNSAVSSAQNADDDACKDFAPAEGCKEFSDGAVDADVERLFERTKEFSETIKKEYPLIHVMNIVTHHKRTHTLFRTTRGTEFDNVYGNYSISFEFCADNGKKATGLAFTGFSTSDLGEPFIEQAGTRKKIETAIAQLDEEPLTGKFVGDVIFTPDCLMEMYYYLMNAFASSSCVLDGTSPWKDKVGQKVVSDKVTVTIDPHDDRMAYKHRYNSEGYLVEKIEPIKNGVLTDLMLPTYVANKVKKPVTKTTGGGVFVKAGDISVDDMIKSVKRGILVGSVSCGHPGTNGEFSGVAKNAFLIEDGEIKHAVNETMLSGNLSDVFNNVRSISAETVEDGFSSLPYMCVENMTITGR